MGHRRAHFSLCEPYGPHVSYPYPHVGWRSSRHQGRGEEGSDNTRDSGNDHNKRSWVREGSHCDREANS